MHVVEYHVVRLFCAFIHSTNVPGVYEVENTGKVKGSNSEMKYVTVWIRGLLYNDIVAHMIKKFQLLQHRRFYFLLCSEVATTGRVQCNSSISKRNLTKALCAHFISVVKR